jgi:hypothetical protein
MGRPPLHHTEQSILACNLKKKKRRLLALVRQARNHRLHHKTLRLQDKRNIGKERKKENLQIFSETPSSERLSNERF